VISSTPTSSLRRKTLQLIGADDGTAKLSRKLRRLRPCGGHGRARSRKSPPSSRLVRPGFTPWASPTSRAGRARARPQIPADQQFAELLTHLLAEAELVLPGARRRSSAPPLQIVDMGCGKGYLTFAVSSLLGPRAVVRGVEARRELVELCNEVARAQGFATTLSFAADPSTTRR